jgi:hypothetical protein
VKLCAQSHADTIDILSDGLMYLSDSLQVAFPNVNAGTVLRAGPHMDDQAVATRRTFRLHIQNAVNMHVRCYNATR